MHILKREKRRGKKKEPREGTLGAGGGSEEGLGEELPQMGEGQHEGNVRFRLLLFAQLVEKTQAGLTGTVPNC